MQRSFNIADKALVCTTVLFIMLIIVKINYPSNLYLKGLLFCVEAALVGGIADWFAVTALFKKPLGFPYHTEIIPRKKDQVIAGCIKLVQNEFFSKKQAVLWAKESSVVDYIIAYSEKNNYQQVVTKLVLDYLPKSLNEQNAPVIAQKLRDLLAGELTKINLLPRFSQLIIDYINSEQGSLKINQLLQYLKTQVLAGKLDNTVRKYLEEFLEQQNTGFLSSLMILIAKQTNVINVDELVQIVKEQLAETITTMLNDPNNHSRRSLVDEFKHTLQNLPQNKDFSDCFLNFQVTVFNEIKMQELLEQLILSLRGALTSPTGLVEPNLNLLETYLKDTMTQVFNNIKYDLNLKKNLEEELDDFLARALLEGRNMTAVIITAVLEEKNKTEFNNLIYNKVEEDLIWIRMNGCIVGAVIGIIIFCGLELFNRM